MVFVVTCVGFLSEIKVCALVSYSIIANLCGSVGCASNW